MRIGFIESIYCFVRRILKTFSNTNEEDEPIGTINLNDITRQTTTTATTYLNAQFDGSTNVEI